MSPLADVSTKGWNAVIDTNLNGTYYCLKHGIELLHQGRKMAISFPSFPPPLHSLPFLDEGQWWVNSEHCSGQLEGIPWNGVSLRNAIL